MAELPNDPRLLAQEILAGRVSIQDLAREQARRRAAENNPAAGQKPASPPPPATAKAKVAPRPASGQIRPGGSYPPATRKAANPGRVGNQPQSGSKGISRPATGAVIKLKAAPSGAVPAAKAAPSAKKNAPASSTTASPRVSRDRDARSVIRRVLASPSSVRSVYLISELLGPPVCMRKEGQSPFGR